MSRTTMYLLDLDNKKVLDEVELKNAWGSAPYVWDKMATTYLHWDSWLRSDCKPLWDLFNDTRIQEYQRAVLGMTFDRAIIRREHFFRAIADIKKFVETFPPEPTHVNHWGAISDYLYIKSFDVDSNIGIGFWMTSVSENSLFVWDEETEEEKFNEILFDLYEELGKAT